MEGSLSQINGALAVIDRLLPLTDQAERKFKSARNWGFVDLLGGGLVTDLIKYSRLNSAGGIMSEISGLLNELRRELGGLEMPSDYQMRLGGFSTFADFVFDGVLADAWVESKIISSIDQVRLLRERLVTLRRELAGMQNR